MKACMVAGCSGRHEARGYCGRHYAQLRRTGQPIPAPFVPTSCSESDCDRSSRERGLCHMHAARFYRVGHTAGAPTLRERFERLVERTPGCWLWRGVVAPNGYAQISVDNRMRYAHRVSHELHIGPIPDGLEIDHVRARGCRHRHCVNPEHLEAVTHAENVRRIPRVKESA